MCSYNSIGVGRIGVSSGSPGLPPLKKYQDKYCLLVFSPVHTFPRDVASLTDIARKCRSASSVSSAMTSGHWCKMSTRSSFRTISRSVAEVAVAVSLGGNEKKKKHAAEEPKPLVYSRHGILPREFTWTREYQPGLSPRCLERRACL